MALDDGTMTDTLPCIHHPRVEDTMLNQVLMAGLELAASVASVVELRRESQRLVALMKDQVSMDSSKWKNDGSSNRQNESSNYGLLVG